jgi:hypothetical protein
MPAPETMHVAPLGRAITASIWFSQPCDRWLYGMRTALAPLAFDQVVLARVAC